jgi:hypothetical protein
MEPRRGARQKLKPRRIVNDTTSRWPAIHAYSQIMTERKSLSWVNAVQITAPGRRFSACHM